MVRPPASNLPRVVSRTYHGASLQCVGNQSGGMAEYFLVDSALLKSTLSLLIYIGLIIFVSGKINFKKNHYG